MPPEQDSGTQFGSDFFDQHGGPDLWFCLRRGRIGGLCHRDLSVVDLQVESGFQRRLHVPDGLLRRHLGGGEKMDFIDLTSGPSHDTDR